MQGYPDGAFRPEQVVNTAEAMKMILAAHNWNVIVAAGSAAWYEPYTEALHAKHVQSRFSSLPWAPLTRAHAAELLYRVLLYEEEKVTMHVSPGCILPASTVPTTLRVEGRERTFLLQTPQNHDRRVPAPVIVAFHGRTNSNEQVRAYYKLDAALQDAYIVYPAAIRSSNGSFSWTDGSGRPDMALFDGIIRTLGDHACIDMDRIFVVGHSLGAWMANSVACLRGRAVRASATVGGDSVLSGCTGPAAALIAHNPQDNLAPFAGAERTRDLRTSVNSCGLASSPANPSSLHCSAYACPDGNPVLFCPHTESAGPGGSYYPHTWPEGMGRMIAEFFGRLP